MHLTSPDFRTSTAPPTSEKASWSFVVAEMAGGFHPQHSERLAAYSAEALTFGRMDPDLRAKVTAVAISTDPRRRHERGGPELPSSHPR